jgi:hypothetical protein
MEGVPRLFHGPFPAAAFLLGLPFLLKAAVSIFSCPDLQFAKQRGKVIFQAGLAGVFELSGPAVAPVSASDRQLQDPGRDELGMPDRLPAGQRPWAVKGSDAPPCWPSSGGGSDR